MNDIQAFIIVACMLLVTINVITIDMRLEQIAKALDKANDHLPK